MSENTGLGHMPYTRSAVTKSGLYNTGHRLARTDRRQCESRRTSTGCRNFRGYRGRVGTDTAIHIAGIGLARKQLERVCPNAKSLTSMKYAILTCDIPVRRHRNMTAAAKVIEAGTAFLYLRTCTRCNHDEEESSGTITHRRQSLVCECKSGAACSMGKHGRRR